MSANLVFYYRNGCHLCEDMWQHLRELQQDRPFDVKPVDIDLDSRLQKQYGTLIPVLAAEEQVICHYYLDPVALMHYLDGSTGGG